MTTYRCYATEPAVRRFVRALDNDAAALELLAKLGAENKTLVEYVGAINIAVGRWDRVELVVEEGQ